MAKGMRDRLTIRMPTRISKISIRVTSTLSTLDARPDVNLQE